MRAITLPMVLSPFHARCPTILIPTFIDQLSPFAQCVFGEIFGAVESGFTHVSWSKNGRFIGDSHIM